MNNKPFGLWDSPVSPQSMSLGLRLNDVAWDSDGQTLVWVEGRSDRGVLVAQRNGAASNDLTTDLNVRGKVGYGGGELAAGHGMVVFSADGRLYRQSLGGGLPRPITPMFGAAASPAISADGKWVAFVHSYENKDVLAVVDIDGKEWPQIVMQGDDFYMQPAWHPDGTRLAAVAWNYPNMPWDGTELRIIRLEQTANGLSYAEQVETLAGDTDTAIFQPVFSPDGQWLAYVSDASGWGHVMCHNLATGETRQLSDGAAEHARPAWVQGMRTLAWTPDSSAIYAVRSSMGSEALWRFPLEGEAEAVRHAPYTAITQPAVSADGTLAFLASASRVPARVVTLTPGGKPQVVRRSQAEVVPETQYSEAKPVSWKAPDGSMVHGLFYAPVGDRNDLELPPLIVNVHGGPTSQRVASFNADAQYWATRGYAVLEVNYRGSTGFGREYMLKGRGTWGLFDREDAVTGARAMADAGWVDGKRLVISGGSAGGTTVLMALVNNPGIFSAGVCRFGVSNMFLLAAETHKFEARYTDLMIGVLPDDADTYRARSAMMHADRIVDPIIVFQGDEDTVVPRNQSDLIVESLKRRGVTHEYHVYQGEGHGFRKAETIAHYYNAVESFLRNNVLFA